MYLQNTHDVTIANASANADDTGGYVLDGANTYNVTLTNSTAEAGGPICISLNGIKTPKGISFSNVCHTRTDDPTPPPSSCKS